jgi:hypothetical protein
MPTALRHGPYRFFFHAGDRDEPPHVHVERERMVAKFWLEPVRLSRSGDFGRKELWRIESVVTEHRDQMLEAWNEFFTD